jgi:predicted CXXCH cytochrome family protein
VFVILFSSVALACAGLACSQTTRHRWLTFFLDGVPQPGQEEAARAPEPETASSSTAPERPAPSIPLSAHPPFRQNQCGQCHNNRTGQLHRKLEDGFCQMCHRDFLDDATYVHGPAAVGECLFCHHYHNSTFPKLLLGEETDLCLRCHDREDLTKGRYHAAEAKRSCGACHDPHGGDNPSFLLAQDWGEYLHGPVAVGDCDFCHHYRAPHAVEDEPTGPSHLCHRCHREADLTTGQHHATLPEQACVDCHDPHGGADRFFLRPSQP